MKKDYYILSGKQPILEPNRAIWKAWMYKADLQVALTVLDSNESVSTKFIGVDHSFGLTVEPMLFETKVIGGRRDGATLRYATWDEAERMHSQVVRDVMGNPTRLGKS